MTLDPRLYLVGQLLVGWGFKSTALPGEASIDQMIRTADLILERMKATEAEAARQRFAEARAIERNDPEEDRVRAFANRGLVSTEFRCFLCGVDIRALGRTKCCQRDSCPYVERQKLQIACDAQSQSAEAGNVKE